MEKVFEIYIKATPDQVWEAITDPQTRAKYNFGASPVGGWEVGTRQQMKGADAGFVIGECDVLEVDPPRRLVHTLDAYFSDEARAEGTSRVTWELTPVGDSCQVRIIHDQMREGACDQLYGGWPMILSGLKTWLETGELLTTPGSLMYT
jgi:uncharacterized protein YndB with AHSA1/START domain